MRRVLVTGSSNGIGAGLAVALARRGDAVGVCGRDTERLRAVLTECQRHSPKSRAWPVDLHDHQSLEGFVRRAEEELGGIDVLVNNAGIPKRRLAERLTPAEVEEVTSVNYVAPVLLTLAALPAMLARHSGRIVNVASVAGRLGSPGESAYAGSKAALHVWSEALAVEVASRDVVVQIVVLGPVATGIVDAPGEDPPLAARAGMGRLSIDDAVGQIVAHMDTSKLEAWIPGSFREFFYQKVADPDRSVQRAGEWFAEHFLKA